MKIEVNKLHKKIRMTLYDAIKYQIITEIMFLKKEKIINSDIEILTLLGLWGPINLSNFCFKAAVYLYPDLQPEEYAIRSQNVRNRIVKLQKRNIVVKNDKKAIALNPEFKIVGKGNVLIDYNFLAIESNKA